LVGLDFELDFDDDTLTMVTDDDDAELDEPLFVPPATPA
jgi:hypothetical protein